MKDIYPVPKNVAKTAHINAAKYKDIYARSVNDPEGFWAEMAERLEWSKRWTKVKNADFTNADIAWFEGAELNVCSNCVDRHLKDKADQTAILWEGDNPAEDKRITYKELYTQVCKAANLLKKLGVKKGDRVTLYMPMIPEAAYAMLACARIGAVHSVVFGGFSPEALRGRIQDAKSRIVITADEGIRGGKPIPLKKNVDTAIQGTEVERVLVVRRTGGSIPWDKAKNHWWHEGVASVSADCPAEPMGAEDPLFILYTSGSTGKPKGVQHTGGGYLLYTSLTHEWVFDYHPGDVYWCTADVGWITGHSYLLYGPLANGATTLMFEGVPNYPDPSRFWQVVDKHKVTIFYTAPTAIRALMRDGDQWVAKTKRSSLRILGSVGEPINPEAWRWYYEVVGEGRCPIVDTWWQTETGGILLTPLPGATAMKPGAACAPFFGITPVIVDAQSGTVLEGEAEGALCIADSWPGQARTVFGDHKRFFDTYFAQYKGLYFSGDGARRDGDGAIWITGRMDDVLKVSGHRLGTAEIESALVAHPDVTEAAVVGFPHDIKGEGIYVYVTLRPEAEVSGAAALKEREALKQWVRKHIGPVATPDVVHLTPGLPKTRSGKIMRRILRKIAAGKYDDLGDTSTLLNPEVVESLIEERRKAS